MDSSFLFNFKRSVETARRRLLPAAIFSGAILIAALPAVAEAKVFINEIAWMGTSSSANAEWIELYNDANQPVTLDGWTLEAADGSPKVALKGSIAAGGFFLLERTSDDSVPGIAADQIYSGSLGNDGELLVLKDQGGAEIDRVDGQNSWKIGGDSVAGDNATKQTAQRFSSGWATATATPRAENRLPPAAIAPIASNDETSAVPSSSSSSSPLPSSSVSIADGSLPYSSHSDAVALSSLDADQNTLEVGAGRPRVVAPGALLSFVATFKSKTVGVPGFAWTFGDGGFASGQAVSHRFLFPGDYEVVLNADSGGSHGVTRTHVHVPELKLSISMLEEGTVEIRNAGSGEVNIGGWSVRGGGAEFVLPADTIIAAQKKIEIPQSLSHMPQDASSVSLEDPIRRTVAASLHAPISPAAAVPALTATDTAATSSMLKMPEAESKKSRKSKSVQTVRKAPKLPKLPKLAKPASKKQAYKPPPLDQTSIFLPVDTSEASSSGSWISRISGFLESWF